jgi:hypothetical protein
MKNLFKIICFAIVLCPTALYANMVEKKSNIQVFQQEKFVLQDDTLEIMMIEYIQNIKKIELSIEHFETVFKYKETSVDNLYFLWMGLAQKFQKYDISFVENDEFKVPTQEQFMRRVLDLSYAKQQLGKRISDVENLLY